MSAAGRTWHVALHAQPTNMQRGEPQDVVGLMLRPLRVGPADQQHAFACTFEQALGGLERLPRMFVEPDGSFVQTSPTEEAAWQLDGVLYDAGAQLAYVELKGSAPPPALDALLTALGWPEQRVMFQLVQQALFLDEADFRRWAFG